MEKIYVVTNSDKDIVLITDNYDKVIRKMLNGIGWRVYIKEPGEKLKTVTADWVIREYNRERVFNIPTFSPDAMMDAYVYNDTCMTSNGWSYEIMETNLIEVGQVAVELYQADKIINFHVTESDLKKINRHPATLIKMLDAGNYTVYSDLSYQRLHEYGSIKLV